MNTFSVLPVLLFVWMTLTLSALVVSTKKVDTTKIVGGQVAGEGNATYQVSLQVRTPPSHAERYFHFCSGSILSERHIVTAAHCLVGWRPDEISVVAGTSVWNKGGVRRVAKWLETHANYVNLGGNDIGIITLDEPLEFGKMISSIAINDEYVPAGVECILTGWGYTLAIRDPGFIPQWVHAIFKSYPKDLQITKVKTISNEECKRSFASMNLDTELCTYKWSTGACAGDSGGPLVNLDQSQLLGVVSFGFIYCGGYTGFPDAFTRVSNFTQWINERIK